MGIMSAVGASEHQAGVVELACNPGTHPNAERQLPLYRLDSRDWNVDAKLEKNQLLPERCPEEVQCLLSLPPPTVLCLLQGEVVGWCLGTYREVQWPGEYT